MAQCYLRTSQISQAVGVHPNTVRLYEQWGFLSPVLRSPSGYRLFTETHLDQMRLARLALHGGWPGRAIRRSALALVRQTAAGNLESALDQARQHLALVQAERVQAEEAVSFLEQWADGDVADVFSEPLSISQAAHLLAVTIDILRNWERNGLLTVPRAPNGYRSYGPEQIDRLLVIRTLRRARYSTMAILRILRSLDAGQTGALRDLLDMPFPDAEIEDYPTNTWLSTLAGMAQAAESMLCNLRKLANPP